MTSTGGALLRRALRPSGALSFGLRCVSTSQSGGAAKAAAVDALEEKRRRLDRAKPEESDSFCMNMFRGKLATSQVFPYPDTLTDEQREILSMITGPTEKFFEEINDASANDEKEMYPKEVLDAFAELGAFGAVVPIEYEGSGMNNSQMARLAEIVGGHDLAMGVTMGAHQSIGYKGILLYGSEEQKKKYLPDLATGRKFASFCLTEPGSGSDANSIRSRAELSSDGKHYILNGNKIWISNGGFADIFTVFAKTPVTKDGVTKDKVSAFVVERGFGGLTNGPPEKKLGIKASNTVELHFDNVKIPRENLLGAEGEGFKVAMNILNNGRFGIPAAMTGTIRFCMNSAIKHAAERVQFGRTLKDFKDIQRKIADMSLKHYVTESVTYLLAGNMDRGIMDYQLEAAVGKIVGSENAWLVCDDAIQILGGNGFMKSAQLERFLRDLRIFRIFEGANDILRIFIALTGMQFAGGHLRQLARQLKNPLSNMSLLFSEGSKRARRVLPGALAAPAPQKIEGIHGELKDGARVLASGVDEFGHTIEYLLRKHKKGIIEEQNQLRLVADAAIDLYCLAAVLSRCSRSMDNHAPSADNERMMTLLFAEQAGDRIAMNLSQARSNVHAERFDRMSHVAQAAFAAEGPPQAHVIHTF